MLTFKHLKNNQIELLIIVIVVVYLFFPTRNSTLDAYDYATSIKYNVDLFSPHHLLYNALQYFILKILLSIHLKIDVLLMTKIVNTIFQFFNLYILYFIFKLLKINKKEIILYLLIIGFSYSSIRFSTENENYIIPITFSLLASYFYLKYINTNSLIFIFYSGLFVSIACLFHQIHMFWWLGIFIGITIYIRKIKTLFFYTISALIIPIAYLMVIYYYNHETVNTNNILHFVFHDYYSGSAKSEFGVDNFIFITISSIRTFFQVHPIILSLIKKNYLFIIPLLMLTILLLTTVKTIINKKMFSARNADNNTRIFINTHIIIIILHFLFAFYAVGNIEFLVMLPFLVFISIFYLFKINTSFLKVFAITLIIWNFSYGLLANNIFKHYNDDILVDFIIQHPTDIFFVSEHTVLTKYSYKTGNSSRNIESKGSINSIKSIHKINPDKDYFYTDIINKPHVFNRASILEENSINLLNKRKELIKTYQGLYGISYIYKVYY